MRLISILAVLLAVQPAFAQPTGGAPPAPPTPPTSAPTPPAPSDPILPRDADKAEADRLFEEGRELLAQGNRAEACRKFDLSLRKDPRAVGTMLNVGLCREETGQIATASRLYAEARDRARDQGLTEHSEAADRKIALLAPRIPHLWIELPAGLPPTTRILVDDLVILREEAGDVVVDPGPHTVIVTAPGKLPFETKVEAKESERTKVVVTVLEGQKTVVVQEPTNRRALIGKILVASGAALFGGGIGVSLIGRSQYWDEFPAGARDGNVVMPDAEHDCWTGLDGTRVVRECNARGREATQSARRLSQIGGGMMIAGAAVAIGGAVLWVTAPRSKEPSQAVTLDVHAGGASVGVIGRF